MPKGEARSHNEKDTDPATCHKTGHKYTKLMNGWNLGK
jgi:hypothetical protein